MDLLVVKCSHVYFKIVSGVIVQASFCLFGLPLADIVDADSVSRAFIQAPAAELSHGGRTYVSPDCGYCSLKPHIREAVSEASEPARSRTPVTVSLLPRGQRGISSPRVTRPVLRRGPTRKPRRQLRAALSHGTARQSATARGLK